MGAQRPERNLGQVLDAGFLPGLSVALVGVPSLAPSPLLNQCHWGFFSSVTLLSVGLPGSTVAQFLNSGLCLPSACPGGGCPDRESESSAREGWLPALPHPLTLPTIVTTYAPTPQGISPDPGHCSHGSLHSQWLLPPHTSSYLPPGYPGESFTDPFLDLLVFPNPVSKSLLHTLHTFATVPSTPGLGNCP